MIKRLMSVILPAALAVCLVPGVGRAATLLTEEEALEDVFGKNAKTERESKTLEGGTLAKVKERLGGELVHFREGSQSKKVEEKTTFEFIFQVKDGKRTGVAILDSEPGKWGPVVFIIAMDPATGAVTRVSVMSYEEKRGKPIARRTFMGQFEGKTTKDQFKLGKDITSISGATISSDAAVFAVKKAVVLYGSLYLAKKDEAKAPAK